MSDDLKCDLCGGSDGTIIPYNNFEHLAHKEPMNCIHNLSKIIKKLENSMSEIKEFLNEKLGYDELIM
jgi:hypothetical protein